MTALANWIFSTPSRTYALIAAASVFPFILEAMI